MVGTLHVFEYHIGNTYTQTIPLNGVSTVRCCARFYHDLIMLSAFDRVALFSDSHFFTVLNVTRLVILHVTH